MKQSSLQPIQAYLLQLQETVAQLPADLIAQVIEILLQNVRSGGKVFLCGNGGSASTASHFACDLAKNTVIAGAPHFKVIALTDNMALVTAWANDTAYDNVFAAQLDPLVQAGDIVIGISCSGNSKNVINAMRVARQHGATTIAFTGDHGGQLKNVVDLCIKAPSPRIEQQEDIHLILEHCICAAVRDRLAQEYSAIPPRITYIAALQDAMTG
ncbi:MAG: SIS domain-containing protein [Anaerolineae bacterium]|nr:SIS domain-containing protein [Anaerolineae bacterium]